MVLSLVYYVLHAKDVYTGPVERVRELSDESYYNNNNGGEAMRSGVF